MSEIDRINEFAQANQDHAAGAPVAFAKSRIVVDATAPITEAADLKAEDCEIYVCESHPNRELGRMPSAHGCRLAKVYPADPNESEWDIYVTDSGWAIGDMKLMIAVCPECAAANYEIVRGK